MQSTLMGKCRLSDEWSGIVGTAIQNLVDVSRDLSQFMEFVLTRQCRIYMKSKTWDDGTQVSIACTFSNTIDCSLYKTDPCMTSGNTVGNSHAAIVVAMYANGTKWFKVFHKLMCCFFDRPWHSSTIRITHNQAAGSCVHCRLAASHRILLISLVSIKEMLQIHKNGLAQLDQIFDRIMDHLQILLSGSSQNFGYLPRMGLDDHTNGGNVRIHQSLDLWILLHSDVFSSTGSKGNQFIFRLRWQFRLSPSKELCILWVASRPSGFDVIHVKGTESFGNLELVVARG
mmetsp:Transcript_7594/g.13365  ORF Transcript_7594/g.13365 Transcript_7594/m.13365 type:complete len:286 (-) Transcript_7594:423-1280(-)